MTIKQLVLTLSILPVFYACQQKEDLAAKKEELTNLKKQQHELKTQIVALEEEISRLDPEFAKANRKATLVTTVPVSNGTFQHMIEVSGSVRSKGNVVLSAENNGNLTRVAVVEGDYVRKGQLIASQDAEVLQKQLAQLETQYELAKEMFKKQSNLWERKIGTEVQYLEAKSNKETLEQQIANVKAQIAKSSIRAPFDGMIERVHVNDGEMATPGMPIARLVSNSDLYVSAAVSESYIGSFDRGDTAIIEFPSLGKTIKAKITAIGQVIDEQNRTFNVEVKLPRLDFKVKPNLISIVKIKDFEKPNSTSVPTNLIQQDRGGEYVYVAEKNGDQFVAKKAPIERGRTYKNRTLVLNGLSGSEKLIKEGFRDVIDGSPVKVVENVL